jgi:hypothetical protein
MKRIILGLMILSLPVFTLPSFAQMNQRQERLVLAQEPIPLSQLPGVRLVRKGDSLLLAVRILNDSIQPARRQQELKETLSNMLEAAEADQTVELSVVDKEGYITELTSVDRNVDILGSTAQRGMSHIDIRLKTSIPADTIDGQALVKRLRDFVESTDTVGRTVVSPTGKVDISILDPDQYRGEIIKLIAAEINLTKGELGNDYKVILDGLEKPLSWRRTGVVELELYIPYRYRVIPGSITSIAMQ